MSNVVSRARELRKDSRGRERQGVGPTLAHFVGMLLCDRDWLLLRARLRYFVSLDQLPRMTTMNV